MSSESQKRLYATSGDLITAQVTAEHVANLVSVGVFFAPENENDERQTGVPEIVLGWEEDQPDPDPPTHSGYFGGNSRQSVYTVRGVVPANTPPGVYRASSMVFRTNNGRWVRYADENLDEQLRAYTLEIYDERPTETRPLGFRFE